MFKNKLMATFKLPLSKKLDELKMQKSPTDVTGRGGKNNKSKSGTTSNILQMTEEIFGSE